MQGCSPTAFRNYTFCFRKLLLNCPRNWYSLLLRQESNMSRWKHMATEASAAHLGRTQTPECLGWASAGVVMFCLVPIPSVVSTWMGVTPYFSLQVIKQLLCLTSSIAEFYQWKKYRGARPTFCREQAVAGGQGRTPGWAPRPLTLATWLQQISASVAQQGVVWGAEVCKTTCLRNGGTSSYKP